MKEKRMTEEEFLEKLDDMISASGLTRREIGEKADISDFRMMEIVQMGCIPLASEMKALADLFGVYIGESKQEYSGVSQFNSEYTGINFGPLQYLTDEQLKDVTKTEDDPVNHPAHYTDGKIEVIEFIEDKKLGFHLGNAVKYIARAGKKDPDKSVEDLKKARWYLDRWIEHNEKEKAEKGN